ncbi:MAG TPA: permease [Thermohalobaculum sp.]|nr:permease [Thermohalobaculum sp.]
MTELVLQRAGALWRGIRARDQVWLLILAIPLLLVVIDPGRAGAVLATAVTAFGGTVPFMAIAVALIAWLKATGAEGIVAQAFVGRESRMIVLAALAGGLMPFCSCEVIPFIAALLAAGTPISAVMAFWLSSPLMDPPQFMITTAALGSEFAVAKLIFAVMIGLGGGFAMQAISASGAFAQPLKAQPGCRKCCGASALTGKPFWRFWAEGERRETFRTTAWEQTLFLTKWLSLAYLLEGLLVQYVPAEAIGALVGGSGFFPVVMGALVGAPAYLNGYAAPPLVAGLMEQGMSAGAAMAFMVAGAVSCIPAMAAVWALVKREVFALYVAFGIGGAILSGLIFGAVSGM